MKEITIQEVLANAKVARIKVVSPFALPCEENKAKRDDIMKRLKRKFGGIHCFENADFIKDKDHITIKKPSQYMLNQVFAFLALLNVKRPHTSYYFPALPMVVVDDKYVIEVCSITGEVRFYTGLQKWEYLSLR